MPEKDPFNNKELAEKVEDVAICGALHGNGCGCDMVYPIDWEQAVGTTWRVTLRCPNCEDVTPALMDENLIEVFDADLDRGTDAILRDLRDLTHHNMATEIDDFVGRLFLDDISPEDF